MYRIVFVSSSRSLVVAKNLSSKKFYVFDRMSINARFEHWAQADSMLTGAYEGKVGMNKVFEKSKLSFMEILNFVLQEAYSSGYYSWSLRSFKSLRDVWKWVHDENEGVQRHYRCFPVPADKAAGESPRMTAAELSRILSAMKAA